MNRAVFALVALSLMPGTPFIQTAPGADQSLVIRPPEARLWTLDNGLTIIVREDRSAPVASVQAWCETGSIHEGDWMGAGLSHILEHMLFKGTESRGASAIANEIQDLGGYINAYTSFDRTVYWIDLPAEGVPTALDVLCDAMMNSTLPEDEYVKEQEVIRREFAMGDDSPDRVGQKLLFATAYQVHPYRHPVIGHLEVYNRLTRDDVMAYYKKRYVPNNLFFVVVGDVDAEAVKERIEAAFADHLRQPLAPVFLPQEPAQTGRRDAHREFPAELSRLFLAWHIPPLTHPDVPAIDLLATLFGSGRSSRLYRELREGKGLAHQISAFSYTPGQSGLFGVGAVADPDKRETLQSEVLAMIAALAEDGVSAAELEKAKRQTLASHLEGLTTMRGQASDLGSSWLLVRDLNFTDGYLDAIQKVTPEDLRRVAATYLRPDNLTVTSINPPGTLAAESSTAPEVDAAAIRRFELSNGLRVLVREDPRLPLVSANLVFRGGVLAEPDEKSGLTKLLARMLPKGTATRSGDAIADLVESVGGSLSSDSGNNTFNVAVDVMQPDLALGMEILADVAFNPAFPAPALEIERAAQLAEIKAQQDEITRVAGEILRAALFEGHPYSRSPLGIPETVSAFSPDDLRAFHRERLHAQDAVLAVFGDVRADEVVALAEKHFAALPASRAPDAAGDPPAFTKTREVARTMDRNQAVLMVGYRGVDLAHPDRFALELIDQASSDLGSRFFVRIRDTLGLAYFVGSSMTPGPVQGSFAFYVGTDPAKADLVREALEEEIAKLAREGLTDAELERAKKKYLGQLQIRNQANSAYAHLAALDELYGLGYDHSNELPALIGAITPDQIRAAAAKYFLDRPHVVALVAPEPKPENPE